MMLNGALAEGHRKRAVPSTWPLGSNFAGAINRTVDSCGLQKSAFAIIYPVFIPGRIIIKSIEISTMTETRAIK